MYDLCIIGFGVSGISCAKHALEKKLNFIVLEQQSELGGCWVDKAFSWTKLQTHKKYYKFPDLDIESKAEYPNKTELINYFDTYVKKHNLLEYVRFNSKVKIINKNKYCWNIKFILNNETLEMNSRYIAVCSGLFTEPYIPKIESLKHFTGLTYHSSDLIKKNMDKLKDKTILIVGNGASCSDLINGLIDQTKHITVLYRTPKWYVRRYVFGISISFVICNLVLKISKMIPDSFFIWLFSFVLSFYFRNSIENPKEKVKYNNLVADDNFIDYFNKGRFTMIQGEIKLIDKKLICLKKKDNSSIINNYDVIVFATGYTQEINFLGLKTISKNYNYIINPYIENCGFIGLNPSYNWPQVSYYQAEWFINYIKQKIKLPEKKEMIEWIKLKDLEQKSNNLDYFDLTYDSISYLKNLRIF